MAVKKKDKTPLEKQHEDLFEHLKPMPGQKEMSLEQPSPYKIIQTVTTYGAYEDPI